MRTEPKKSVFGYYLPMIRFSLLVVFASSLSGQLTWSDYERATGARAKYQNLIERTAGVPTWDGDLFWYRVSVTGGGRFVLVDAGAKTKVPAFDHARLADGISKAAEGKYEAITLPFMTFRFTPNRGAITFEAKGSNWRCSLTDYVCLRLPAGEAPIGRRTPEADESAPDSMEDGVMLDAPQVGLRSGGAPGLEASVKESPDRKFEALIQNFNVYLRPKGQTAGSFLSTDGSEGNYYTARSITWSPDGKYLVAYRTKPGYRREVHYVESSPSDQLQPKHTSIVYAKPGDTLDLSTPVVFDIAAKSAREVENSQFPNPYGITQPVWRKSGGAFTFEYNQRGHQVYRVIEVAAATGKARTVISEESKSFIEYRPLPGGTPADTGKIVRHDIDDGGEFVWMSERDGWAQLYLMDGATGRVKNRITKGDWVVRSVEKFDDAKRQVWFGASGVNANEDPYFVHYYRVNYDGSGMVALTEEAGNHRATFSPDMRYYVDEWSTVTEPSRAVLRRTTDPGIAMDLENADASKLVAAGWRAPEVFKAKGRDGTTDIWGVIWWPRGYDAAKKYPVVESIYAGPHGSFVPKTFSAASQPLTELGFIVVQIDGMGTNNRSKLFHDVAFQNLKDAGFPDRILWHKAVAAKYPAYDISRVGIFGTSAGGQSAMGALLFHPEFYKSAVANSGCHDNRMDKIWWNELWMGWPIGPQYSASSNVEHAYRLQGDLLLVVPEMDTNVDPASTFQVVNALMTANKKFEMLFVPGGGHGAGGEFGTRLLFDFFVHHLMGVEPPKWQASRVAAL